MITRICQYCFSDETKPTKNFTVDEDGREIRQDVVCENCGRIFVSVFIYYEDMSNEKVEGLKSAQQKMHPTELSRAKKSDSLVIGG